MTALSEFVQVNVSLTGSKSPTRQAFGTPLLAVYHTNWSDRVHFYPAGTVLTQMVAEGFKTTDPAYRAMQVALSQDPTPAQLAIGRRALPFTQILQISLALLVADTGTTTSYAFTVVGSDGISHSVAFPSTGVPATDANTLKGLLNGFPNVGTCTGPVAGTFGQVLTLTQAAGKLTDIQGWATPQGVSAVQIADITADPGIATDLAAISAANTIGWYGLSLDSNSRAEILGAQAFIEATGVGGKFAFYNTCDFPCTQTASTAGHAVTLTASSGDVFTDLQARSYNKEYCQFSGQAVLSYAGFGMNSQILAQNPGSYALSYKSIPGVIVDTDQSLTTTEALIINTASTASPGTGGKNGNYYAQVSGLPISWPGVSGSGQWCDNTIFVDWLQANMQADVFAVLAGLPKVPYTDFGIQLIAAAIKTRLDIGASSQFGGIVDGTQTVTVPRASQVSATDKNNRNLSGLTFTAILSGAVNTVQIQGALTP